MTDFKNKVHIINTIFTGRGQIRRTPEGILEETDEWIDKRIELFKNYCLKSLLNQTNKNFVHWICFRKRHQKFDELEEYLKGIGYNFVFTYNGQCHHDDHGDNSDLIERTAKSLEVLKPYIEGKKWVYYTHLDSDDMLMEDYVDLVQQEEPGERKSLVFQQGYAVNYFTKEVADWFCVSPPFYSIIYPGDIFSDAREKTIWEQGLVSHEQALTEFNAKIMPEYKYSYLIHGNNKSTPWNHDFRGKVYSDNNERKSILKKLGIL
jgi:hypothetical protein